MVGFSSSLGTAFLSLLALNGLGALAHRWFNWQFDITCEATGYFVPGNEADLVEFVRTQYPQKTLLKPVGNGHGFGNLTTCVNDGESNRDSYILSLTNLKHLEIFENKTVTFGGGWDLIDLIPTLEENGLQVANLGSEMVQNYIGAATTGTHGTGKQHQNLANQIIGLRVLDAKGDIHIISQEHTPDLLKAHRIGIGALGIVVEVTLQAEPLSFLKRTSKVVEGPQDITKLYEMIAEYGDKYEQVNIIGPNLDWNVTTEELVPRTSLTLVYWEETDYTGAPNCSVDFCANDCGRCDRDYVCYDYNNYAIATPPAGICYRGFMGQFEHFFPIENLAEAGRDYFNYALSQSDRMKPYQLDNPIEEGLHGGYLSDDDNLPANASGIFATLEYSWIPSYNNYTLQWFYQDLLKEFIPVFGEKYNVRPHWNKMLFNNETYASTIYPKINSWLDIQEQMDPHCQFVNEFLAESLGIERCMSLFQ
ncbi:unnamed protein product [Penicillium nalgiovense]|nr:unnamed protein product [Penicillium nalgiovense]